MRHASKGAPSASYTLTCSPGRFDAGRDRVTTGNFSPADSVLRCASEEPTCSSLTCSSGRLTQVAIRAPQGNYPRRLLYCDVRQNWKSPLACSSHWTCSSRHLTQVAIGASQGASPRRILCCDMRQKSQPATYTLTCSYVF
jgi:hypothetical protein